MSERITAKQYFRQIKRTQDEIVAIQESIDRIREMYGITSAGSSDGVNVQMTKEGRPVEDVILKVATLIETQESKKEELADLFIEGLKMIDTLEEPLDKAVMTHFYVNNRTWEEISEELFISRNTVWRSLVSSLEEIDKRFFDFD